MQKICKQCAAKFEIDQRELDFYKKIEMSLPKLCPDCRVQRRQVFRNDRVFYNRKCDLSGKQFVSTYASDCGYKIYHPGAQLLFRGIEDYVVSDYVLAEVATVLKNKEVLKIAKSALDFLTSIDGIKIHETEPELFWSAMSFFTKTKNKLSFTDTLLLLLSRENRIPLVTFDKELARMAK